MKMDNKIIFPDSWEECVEKNFGNNEFILMAMGYYLNRDYLKIGEKYSSRDFIIVTEPGEDNTENFIIKRRNMR